MSFLALVAARLGKETEMRHSVIACIYNTLPLVKRTVESVLATLPKENELILVDNHSPDPKSRDYIYSLRQSNVHVFTPEKNLGCHNGWNYGFDRSQGDIVWKLDDDTEILTRAWALLGENVLLDVPNLAYVSADINAKQANQYVFEMHGDSRGHQYKLEVAKNGVVGFSFVGFRRHDVIRWGKMQVGPYRATGGKVIAEDRLYGGEEVFFASAARQEGKFIAHYPAIRVHHADNSERHPDYPMWKRVYGYHGWTNLPMDEWILSGQRENHYRGCIAREISVQHFNDALLLEWCKRLGEIGCAKDIALIEAVHDRTKNEAVREVCKKAMELLLGKNA